MDSYKSYRVVHFLSCHSRQKLELENFEHQLRIRMAAKRKLEFEDYSQVKEEVGNADIHGVITNFMELFGTVTFPSSFDGFISFVNVSTNSSLLLGFLSTFRFSITHSTVSSVSFSFVGSFGCYTVLSINSTVNTSHTISIALKACISDFLLLFQLSVFVRLNVNTCMATITTQFSNIYITGTLRTILC